MAAAALVAAGLAPAAAGADSDPGAREWERVPRDRVAAECGMDPELLEAATPRLTDTPFVVVRYGKLCWEGGYPNGTTEPYSVFSITKTFGGLLTGMVDSRSTLSDEDQVTRWIPPDQLGQINPDARIAHVLSMAATNEDLAYGKKRKWTYDTAGDREINRLVGVMDRAIAEQRDRFAGSANAVELAQNELFEPLGMKASSWPGQQIGGNLRSSVRDMARMGELILQRGRYDGRQILDEDFVYKMTHPAFEDSNTGYGYLTYANAEQNWGYSTGTNDTECSPYTRWPAYPHRPFFEAPDPNGGFPGEQKHDIGVVWAAGAGGQRFVVHRGLDLVFAVRDDSVSVGESEPVGAFEGHKNVWNAIRPALVALDPVYRGDEAGFCAAYRRSEYAPDLREAWFTPAGGTNPGGPAPGAAPADPPRPAAPACSPPAGFDAFSVQGAARGGLLVRVARRRDLPFTFSLHRQATGRRVHGDRLVARRRSRSGAFRLAPGRGARDGYYVARVKMRLPGGRIALRRVGLERRGGSFQTRPGAEVRRTCGLLASVTLERPYFGGTRERPLRVAYRLRRPADQVAIGVLGRRARIVRGRAAARRTYRVRLSPRGLPRGRDVRIQIAIRAGATTTTETVTARRL